MSRCASRRLGLRLALASTMLLAWCQTARASEAWSGKIRCSEIPGVSGALLGDFSLIVDGASISFTREVKNVTGGSSGVPERGNGTLNGTAVALQGGAALRQLSYQSTYAGKIDGAKMLLTGEQVWIGGVLQQPFHRRCRIDLTRSCMSAQTPAMRGVCTAGYERVDQYLPPGWTSEV